MNAPPNAAIDQEAIAGAVATERLALCDPLDTLAPDDWQVQSLCPQWTVHDVVAHLTLATRDTVWGLVKAAIKARGNFDRMNADMARAQSAHSRHPLSSNSSGTPPLPHDERHSAAHSIPWLTCSCTHRTSSDLLDARTPCHPTTSCPL